MKQKPKLLKSITVSLIDIISSQRLTMMFNFCKLLKLTETSFALNSLFSVFQNKLF